MIIQDKEVGNLHLTLGAQSLHTIIYFGTSQKNDAGIQDVLQTHQNKVSTNKSVDNINESNIEIGYMLQTYQNKSFTNNSVEHGHNENKIITNFSLVRPGKNVAVKNHTEINLSNAAKAVPGSILFIIVLYFLIL